MQASRALRALTLIVFLLSALAGCGPQTPVKPTLPPATDPDIARAAALMADGLALDAYGLYLGLADRNSGPQQHDFLLLAADALQAANDPERLEQLLSALDGRQLTPTQALHLRLLRAELLLAQRQAFAALERLLDPVDPTMPLALRQRYHRDLAEAYRLSGNALESANERQILDTLLSDRQARLDNQLDIIRTLALMSESALRLLQPSPPGISGGWMELTLAIKQQGHDPETLRPRLDAWRAQYPSHPALPELLEGYFEKIEAQYRRVAHVAILLPESGPYARASTAIRDGILAAWYQQKPERRPVLRFYDASDAANAWPLYNQALAEGAEAVIGPLDKDSVRQMARAGELPAPVLALNQVDSDTRPPELLYQFGLSPEDEAEQAADRMWSDGHRRPIVLTPEGEWGERIGRAFAAQWLILGGELAGQSSYDASGTDFSGPIRGLLHLDRSTARNRALESLLGQHLEFEPRRRADVDSVFLVAKAQQSRLLRPQFQFHHASDLPLYATSHAWDGSHDPEKDHDLSGIRLPDMPWLLADDGDSPLSRSSLSRLLPASGGPYGRLYAMGIDSYRLLPHLARLQSSPQETLDGKTGTLHMDALQHIRRRLIWAELSSRRARVLGYTPQIFTEAGLPGAETTTETEAVPDTVVTPGPQIPPRP